jgi:hypothetical protein
MGRQAGKRVDRLPENIPEVRGKAADQPEPVAEGGGCRADMSASTQLWANDGLLVQSWAAGFGSAQTWRLYLRHTTCTRSTPNPIFANASNPQTMLLRSSTSNPAASHGKPIRRRLCRKRMCKTLWQDEVDWRDPAGTVPWKQFPERDHRGCASVGACHIDVHPRARARIHASATG